MDFFVPDPAGGSLPREDAEHIWQAARKGAEDVLGRDALARRVYAIDYTHNRVTHRAAVGAIDDLEQDLVMAIIEFPDVFVICCRERGVLKIGDPILAAKRDVAHETYFDETSA